MKKAFADLVHEEAKKKKGIYTVIAEPVWNGVHVTIEAENAVYSAWKKDWAQAKEWTEEVFGKIV